MAHRDLKRAAWLLSSDIAGSVLKAHAADSVQARAYCSYGSRTFEGGPSTGFNGESQDTITCGYLLGRGYRLYNPALRRFVGADSLSPFAEGGLNAYAYCEGDPVNRCDPSGHAFSWSGMLKALGLKRKTGQTQLHKDQLSAALRKNVQLEREVGQLKAANQRLQEDLVDVQRMTQLNNEMRKAYRDEWRQLVRTAAPDLAYDIISQADIDIFKGAVHAIWQRPSDLQSTLV